ncbi:ABC transporter permease subunit, partial [Stenotrophomonas maltophilia]|uniref:ABC transporter permease subunit n=1 Tax=Stenotrophomonas maltophilia TaxID=40324 RepID=UPI001952A885
ANVIAALGACCGGALLALWLRYTGPETAMSMEIMLDLLLIVVIGGMGSIMGSIVTGFMLGVLEGLTKYFYPEASNTVVFIFMVLVL